MVCWTIGCACQAAGLALGLLGWVVGALGLALPGWLGLFFPPRFASASAAVVAVAPPLAASVVFLPSASFSSSSGVPPRSPRVWASPGEFDFLGDYGVYLSS